MGKRNNASFHDYFMDEENVSPFERAKIEFGVELIGKLIEVREAFATHRTPSEIVQDMIQKEIAEAAAS